MLLLKLSRTVCGRVCNFTLTCSLVPVTSNLTGIFFKIVEFVALISLTKW